MRLGSPSNAWNLPEAFTSDRSGGVQAYASAVGQFLQDILPLLHVHPVDFLTAAPMDGLRKEWMSAESVWMIEALDHPTVLLSGGEECPRSQTGSCVLSFFDRARQLRMPRHPTTNPVDSEQAMNHAFKLFTSPKKIHEVDCMRLAVLAAIDDACATTATTTAGQVESRGFTASDPCKILEFGGGVGRLAQCLALQHGLQVCGVDCSAAFVRRPTPLPLALFHFCFAHILLVRLSPGRHCVAACKLSV